MTTGFQNQLTKQVGEYLMAAELARIGFICTPFAGNVPHFDIIAVDENGQVVLVQVKAARGGDWQFDIRHFVEARLEGEKQILGEPKQSPYPNLIFVFVQLRGQGKDEFYIISYEELRDILIADYRSYLNRKNGVRPRSPDSFHTIARTKMLKDYKDKWDKFNRLLNQETNQQGWERVELA